jgi:hypothetical protein
MNCSTVTDIPPTQFMATSCPRSPRGDDAVTTPAHSTPLHIHSRQLPESALLQLERQRHQRRGGVRLEGHLGFLRHLGLRWC